jgi:four helix bundle protein
LRFEHILDCGQFSIVDFQGMAFIFENLDVYQKAVDFAEKTGELTKDFPKGNYYLADQLNRALLSISTNIAEGNGRFYKPDRNNFFRIARGSAFECVPILEICRRKMLIGEEKSKSLKIEIENISKMLSVLIK